MRGLLPFLSNRSFGSPLRMRFSARERQGSGTRHVHRPDNSPQPGLLGHFRSAYSRRGHERRLDAAPDACRFRIKGSPSLQTEFSCNRSSAHRFGTAGRQRRDLDAVDGPTKVTASRQASSVRLLVPTAIKWLGNDAKRCRLNCGSLGPYRQPFHHLKRKYG